MNIKTETDENLYARLQVLYQEIDAIHNEQLSRIGLVVNLAEVKAECRSIKSSKGVSSAVRVYRDKVGCGLREAHDVVMRL